MAIPNSRAISNIAPAEYRVRASSARRGRKCGGSCSLAELFDDRQLGVRAVNALDEIYSGFVGVARPASAFQRPLFARIPAASVSSSITLLRGNSRAHDRSASVAMLARPLAQVQSSGGSAPLRESAEPRRAPLVIRDLVGEESELLGERRRYVLPRHSLSEVQAGCGCCMVILHVHAKEFPGHPARCTRDLRSAIAVGVISFMPAPSALAVDGGSDAGRGQLALPVCSERADHASLAPASRDGSTLRRCWTGSWSTLDRRQASTRGILATR